MRWAKLFSIYFYTFFSCILFFSSFLSIFHHVLISSPDKFFLSLVLSSYDFTLFFQHWFPWG